MKRMWLLFAILSAVFAAATSILAAIFLGEAFTWKTFLGSLMIVGGTLIMII